MAYYSVWESKLVKVLQSYTEQRARKRHRAASSYQLLLSFIRKHIGIVTVLPQPG